MIESIDFKTSQSEIKVKVCKVTSTYFIGMTGLNSLEKMGAKKN